MSGVKSTQGNREEQGDKMEGMINSEDPVFVSVRHVSVGSKNNLKQLSLCFHSCSNFGPLEAQTVSNLAHYSSLVLVFQQQ